VDTAERYRRFAVEQARGQSPAYEAFAHAVAADPALLARLDDLPLVKRQPNLLFGAVRYLGGPPDAGWARQHWDEVAAVMRARSTQTNEAGRCAVLLPLLVSLPQPLALLEVGASAGLCLYPDAYAYRYNGTALGDGDVVLDCAVTGGPVPGRRPEVVWRTGLDLHPLDLRDDDELRWLAALVWPGQEHRLQRLRGAAAVARADPPLLHRGDLLTDLPALAAQAPPGATLVVFHSAVLTYVAAEDRQAFADGVRDLPGHWIAHEAPGVVPGLPDAVPAPEGVHGPFVLALDGVAQAATGPHGQALRWL
jgi:hypothetical protein